MASKVISHNNINMSYDTSNNTVVFDLSIIKRSRVKGQFGKLQGRHTAAYGLLVRALEKRILGKTIPQLLQSISMNLCHYMSGNLHSDYLNLCDIHLRLYPCVGDEYYISPQFENMCLAYRQIEEQYDEFVKNRLNVDKAMEVIIKYISTYIECLQYLPFSSVEVDPEEEIYGRGERYKFLDKIQELSEEVSLGWFSKLFDESASDDNTKKFIHAKDEIIAYQLMILVTALEGYPEAKKIFHLDAPQFKKRVVFRDKQKGLINLAKVIFYVWYKKENRPFNPAPTHDECLRINSALDVIQLRFENLFTVKHPHLSKVPFWTSQNHA